MNEEKHDLGQVLSYYGAKVRDGYGWIPIKCPVHSDATASAAVNTKEQLFDCFVCDIYGDVYTLIMQKEGLGFKDAINRAETITNGSRTKVSSGARRRNSLLPQVKGNNKRGGRFIPSRHSF